MTKCKPNNFQFWEIKTNDDASKGIKINCLKNTHINELMKLYTIEQFNDCKTSANSTANCNLPIIIFTEPSQNKSIILIFPDVANFNGMELAQLEPLIHQINNTNDKLADIYEIEIAQLVTNSNILIQ